MRVKRITTALVVVAVSATASLTAVASGKPSASGARMHAAHAQSNLMSDIAAARLATAKYATNLARAKTAGYQIITKMIPDMGYHFLNPHVQGFDVRTPPILVYERRRGAWQLGALEWVFTSKPATPPLPGARYGTFPAACHYLDGTFLAESAQSMCPAKSPQTGAAFNFWHPNLITLHFWIWYPNPAGLYSSMNPLVNPFNGS